MGKLLFWVGLGLGVLLVTRLLAYKAGGKKFFTATIRRGASTTTASSPESMVRCAHCGVHLPRSEAALLGGETWCSREHAQLGVRNGS